MSAIDAQRIEQSRTDLAGLIAARTDSDPDFWDFAGVSSRSGGHGFFHYPAMMVPQLQGALLDDLIAADPTVSTVYDPFMGSGTVLLESVYRGLSFHGTDINPLAVLLCHVKAHPPSGELAKAAIDEVLRQASAMPLPKLHTFLHREKWFNDEVTGDLSRLRIAIQSIEYIDLRRFLWICMAETVRLVSNSRISTFKLHIYGPDDLLRRKPDALAVFATVGHSNANRAGSHWARFVEISARSEEMAPTILRGNVSGPFAAPRGLVDAVMTSPPYGDNHTTVPYGQHSYLPLSWIDHDDLVGSFDDALVATPSSLDSASLGGSRRYREERALALPAELPSIKSFMEAIEDNRSLVSKVVAFVDDYAEALEHVSNRLRSGGMSFWTLGERRVRRNEMPLVALTREVLENKGSVHVETVTRKLRRKRMAGRNKSGATMGTEQILIMQKN